MSFDVSAKLIPKIVTTSIIFHKIITPDLFASEDITVITADRIYSTTDKSSSDVRIIGSDEIKKKSTLTLSELLSKESDLNVVSTGISGSSTSLFLRGTDSSHTLFVIDGIVMNDPSNPNRQFDIGRLSLNNIDRIEILKGSQGLSYGSNAIGGVVVITTKKAKSKKLTAESRLDYGTFNTLNIGSNYQAKIADTIGISFGADYMSTEGFSAANEKLNPYAEADGDKRIAFDLGSYIDLSEEYSLDGKILYSHNTAELDKGGGALNDDPNDRQKDKEIYSKLGLIRNWPSGNAQTKFAYNYTRHRRELEILPDQRHPKSNISRTLGKMKTASANHTYYISESFTQNLNADLLVEEDQSGHSNQNISGFIYHQYETSSKIINFGLRLDHNKYFNDHFTYKLAAGYKFESSLLKLSYSTGFRSPSLNQLFDPDYGNKNLTPETSQSAELSLEKKWAPSAKSISTLFYTKINDRFSYTPNTFVNINQGEAEIIGLEKNLAIDWFSFLDQSTSFTLLHARDLNKGEKLARRPDFNLKNVISYKANDKHLLSYEISYVGARDDVDNQGISVKMNSYLLSNLNYRFALDQKNEFFLKIKNLFDKDYEEIYGFGTGGRTITVGSRFNY